MALLFYGCAMHYSTIATKIYILFQFTITRIDLQSFLIKFENLKRADIFEYFWSKIPLQT
ncbi:MAG TPA: hypothetical protein DCS93_06670 [Microscillaceae bacterium]|nr:hypothetical protein [Microscillaceae bacterium]